MCRSHIAEIKTANGLKLKETENFSNKNEAIKKEVSRLKDQVRLLSEQNLIMLILGSDKESLVRLHKIELDTRVRLE